MLRRLNLQGRTLLVVCLFMVSVFIVVLKIMNPIEIHIFLEGEETVLSQVMHNFTLYDVILLLFAAFTGLRAGEVRGLRWSDVDFQQNELHVRQRADRWGDMDLPKSEAGERTVPFGKIVANTLKAPCWNTPTC